MRELSVDMSTNTKTIRMTMILDGYTSFKISAKNDDRWIQGVRGQINDIFKKYQAWYDLFHAKWKYGIPIYFGVSFVFAIIVVGSLNALSAVVGSPERLGYVYIFWMGVSLALLWALFLAWLYPKFETEYTFQARLRKWIWFVIGSIAVTVVGSYVYEYLLPH